MKTLSFKSLKQMLDALRTEEECKGYLDTLRWNGKPVCPHCGSMSKGHYKLTQGGEFKGLYKCRDCKNCFTVRKGIVFENSNLPLRAWFRAICLVLMSRKGIGSCQLAREF